MPNWSRLILPVGFGLIAAVVNWVAMSRHVEPEDFVVVTSELLPGQEITETDITKLSCNFQVAELREVVLPWSERGLVLGRTATRRLTPGTPVLFRDVTPDKVVFRTSDLEERRFLVTFLTPWKHLKEGIVPGDSITIRFNEGEEHHKFAGVFVQNISRVVDEALLSVFLRPEDGNISRLARAIYAHDEDSRIQSIVLDRNE